MRTIYWLFLSNPFLVKALRSRQRGGAVYWRSGIAALASLAGLILVFELVRRLDQWEYLSDYLQLYDGIVFCALFVIGILSACSITNGSICQEIISGTLEFQRLTSLSLRQIVAGKVIGELVSVYLFFLSVLPMLVLSSLFGGYPVPIKLFGLLLCFTTALLFGAVGAVVPIRTVLRTNRPWNLPLGLLLGGGWLFLPPAIAQGCTGVVGLFMGMFTPLPFIISLFDGEFFVARKVDLFGWSVSIEVLSPILHLFFAVIFILIAARNLRMDERPPLPRLAAYAILAVAAFFAMGIAYDSALLMPFAPRSAVPFYLAANAVTVLNVVVFHFCTTRKDGYLRWLWRERDRARWLDYLIGDFSPAWLTAFVFVVAHVVSLAGLVYVARESGNVASPLLDSRWIWSYVSTTVFGLACTLVLVHSCNLAVGYGVVIAGVLELLLLVGATAVALFEFGGTLDEVHTWGPYLGISWILTAAWFVTAPMRQETVSGLAPVVFAVSHAFLAGVAAVFAYGVCRYHSQVVGAKKRSMGVIPRAEGEEAVVTAEIVEDAGGGA